MREYVRNKKCCRREIILKCFREKMNKATVQYDCCDICSPNCECSVCKLAESDTPESQEMKEICEKKSRNVSESERYLFKEVLNEISQPAEGSSIFGMSTLQRLTQEVIQQLCNGCQCVFLLSDLMHDFPTFDKYLARRILGILDDIFMMFFLMIHLRMNMFRNCQIRYHFMSMNSQVTLKSFM